MTMIKKVCALGALFSMLVFAGCATVGQDFATHNVDQLETGETTRSQVQEMFGEPWRTGLKDGKRTWTYGKYRWSAFDEAQTTDLVITFDADDTVESYNYNSTE